MRPQEHMSNRIQICDNAKQARLIAAAPELLSALEAGVNELMRAYKMTRILETEDHRFGAPLNELVMRLNEEFKTAIAKARGDV